MKTFQNSVVLPIFFILTVGLALNFGGCFKESPLGPEDNDNVSTMTALAKGNGKDNRRGGGKEDNKPGYSNYPQFGSVTLTYDKDVRAYTGGNCVLTNGSKLHVGNYSFTPPPQGSKRQPYTITMQVDMVENEKNFDLIFTFGPSGSQFSPWAQIWLDWKDMETGKVPGFYYIEEDGTWTELEPAAVDKQNKKVIAFVSHFSRYALSVSR